MESNKSAENDDNRVAELRKMVKHLESGLKQCQSDRDELQDENDKLIEAFEKITETRHKITQFGTSSAYASAYQIAEQALKPQEMLPPGSAPIYTHSTEYMNKYKKWLKTKDNG